MKNPIEYYDKPRKQNNRDKFYFGLSKNTYICRGQWKKIWL